MIIETDYPHIGSRLFDTNMEFLGTVVTIYGRYDPSALRYVTNFNQIIFQSELDNNSTWIGQRCHLFSCDP